MVSRSGVAPVQRIEQRVLVAARGPANLDHLVRRITGTAAKVERRAREPWSDRRSHRRGDFRGSRGVSEISGSLSRTGRGPQTSGESMFAALAGVSEMGGSILQTGRPDVRRRSLDVCAGLTDLSNTSIHPRLRLRHDQQSPGRRSDRGSMAKSRRRLSYRSVALTGKSRSTTRSPTRRRRSSPSHSRRCSRSEA